MDAVVVTTLVDAVRAELETERDVAELLVVVLPAASVELAVDRRSLRGVLPQQRVRLGLVTGEEALGPALDEERRHRVAGHDVGLAVGQGPAGQPATLAADGEDREVGVAGDVGLEDLEQLVLRPVGVPQREVLARGPAVAGVDLAVPAEVLAVDVLGEVRVEQRVVERGVVGRASAVVPPVIRALPSWLLPPLGSVGAGGVEVEGDPVSAARFARAPATPV